MDVGGNAYIYLDINVRGAVNTGYVVSGGDGQWVAGGQRFTFGANGTGYSQFGWQSSSDARLKQDILPLQGEASCEILRRLRPVTFAFLTNPTRRQVGYIAQDIQKLVPTAVTDHCEHLSLDYNQVAVVTASASQHIIEMVDRQRKLINDLMQRLEYLENP